MKKTRKIQHHHHHHHHHIWQCKNPRSPVWKKITNKCGTPLVFNDFFKWPSFVLQSLDVRLVKIKVGIWWMAARAPGNARVLLCHSPLPVSFPENCTHKKEQQLRIKEKYPLDPSSFAFARSASRMKRAFDNVFRGGKEGKGDGRELRGRKGRGSLGRQNGGTTSGSWAFKVERPRKEHCHLPQTFVTYNR